MSSKGIKITGLAWKLFYKKQLQQKAGGGEVLSALQHTPPLTPSFSFPHGKGSFVLPTDHKPKQETTGFLQQKGRSLSADGNDSANGAELPFQRLKQH